MDEVNPNLVEDQGQVDPTLNSDQPSQSIPQQGVPTPNEFEVNGRKYTPEQIEELERSAMRQEDYTRKTQELAKRNAEIENIRTEYENKLSRYNSIGQENLSPEQEVHQEQLKRQIRALGFMSGDEVNKLLSEKEKSIKEETDSRVREAEIQRYTKEIKTVFDDFESKYDGTDGKPKFDRKKVYDFMAQRGLGKNGETFKDDIEMAYWYTNKQTLLDWEYRNRGKSPIQPTIPTQRISPLPDKRIGSIHEAGQYLSEHFEELG